MSMINFLRGFKGVFLGYSVGQKGYKILNLSTQQMIVSRNVIFHEHTFTFLDKSYNFQNTSSVHPWVGSDHFDTPLPNFTLEENSSISPVLPHKIENNVNSPSDSHDVNISNSTPSSNIAIRPLRAFTRTKFQPS